MNKKHNGPDRPEEGHEVHLLGSGTQSGPVGPGTSGGDTGPAGRGLPGGSDPPEPDGDHADEEVLRRLLQAVTDDLEPSPGALDHLRRAVPARRTRRRQALVGAAAAIVLVGTAMPSLVRVARSGDLTAASPANAGHSENAEKDGSEDASGAYGDGKQDSRPDGKPTQGGSGDSGGGAKGDSPRPGTGIGPGAHPTDTMAAASPACTRAQLGNAAASPAVIGGGEAGYASFRVTNISDTACTVAGGGLVLPASQGGVDSSAIHVVDHTAGDAATGLPDPAGLPAQVILQPGAAYEIKFAWIPAEGGAGGCQTTGASPEPTASAETGDPQTQSSAEQVSDPQPAGSVVLTHTPQAGAPEAASATITNVCAGTVFRTEAMPAS